MGDFFGVNVKMSLSRKLDLHGSFPDEVEYKLASFITECSYAGVIELEIVHGKGEGILKREVLRVLSLQRSLIKRVYPGLNDGVTRVSLNIKKIDTKKYVHKYFSKVEQNNENHWDEEIRAQSLIKKEKARMKYLKRMQRMKI